MSTNAILPQTTGAASFTRVLGGASNEIDSAFEHCFLKSTVGPYPDTDPVSREQATVLEMNLRVTCLVDLNRVWHELAREVRWRKDVPLCPLRVIDLH
jgi:hypothetical protein